MASLEEYIMMMMTDSDSDDDDDHHHDPVAVGGAGRISHEMAFAMSDNQFKKNYRLTKPLVRALVEEIRPFIRGANRASDLTVEMKVLVALSFFATGSYQTCVSCHKNARVSQSSVSKSLQEVVEALNNPVIMGKYVRFPRNPLELNTIAQKFYQLYGIPGIVGCIDCTHVAIYPPPNNDLYDERSYVNRKGYHSINTQLICDADLKIINVNALFPGCTHDNYIWNQSAVQPVMQEIQQRGNYYLIGDSGYALRPWLQVPIAEPNNMAEHQFNEAFKKARATIERCNGVLKGRFRCLLKHRVLHYAPEKATKIINSCVVLHNICVQNNVALDEDENEDDAMDFGVYQVPHEEVPQGDLLAGQALRQSIVQNYFAQN